MKICVAQTRPIRGDVERNIDNHKKIIDVALSNGADMIIFPELSITGYEPELANQLATNQDDNRFDDFQRISNTRQITIGIGMPIKIDAGISISMVLFQSQKERQRYAKKYLHIDEEKYFVSEASAIGLLGNKNNIAIAICYELSAPEHSENAFKSGAEIYIASVAKTASGVEKAYKNLADIARKYSMTTFLSSCIGYCDNFESGGRTAVWDNNGSLVGQLDDKNEGILIFDTDSQELVAKTIDN